MRLYCLSLGLLTFDQSVFTYNRGMGQDVTVPTLSFLIRHPKGNVIYDTGLDPIMATDPESYWGETAREYRPSLTADDTIVPQLAKLGLQPKDVDYVVMSCLYQDHAGGLKYFPDSTIVVQQIELQEAWWMTPSTIATFNDPYKLADLEGTRDFKWLQLDGEDFDIFGDRSVVVLSSPCHAKGEQAVVVRLPETGTVLLPGGVIPTRRNLVEDILTGRLMYSPAEAMRSVNRLKDIVRRENATVLLHHDLEAWRGYRHPPEYYG